MNRGNGRTCLGDLLLPALGRTEVPELPKEEEARKEPPAKADGASKKKPKKPAAAKTPKVEAAPKKAPKMVGPGREVLWNSGRILMTVVVPTEPLFHEKTEHVPAAYHQCIAGVRGGYVKLFFYGLPETATAGTKVIAKAKIVERTHDDGRKTIYVDLHVAQGAEHTHTFHVHSVREQFKRRDETLRVQIVEGGLIEIRRKVKKPTV